MNELITSQGRERASMNAKPGALFLRFFVLHVRTPNLGVLTRERCNDAVQSPWQRKANYMSVSTT